MLVQRSNTFQVKMPLPPLNAEVLESKFQQAA